MPFLSKMVDGTWNEVPGGFNVAAGVDGRYMIEDA
jgi:hypothetical protein